MMKTSGVILAAGLVLGGGGTSAAQMFGPGGGPMGPPSGGGPVPPEMRAMQKAQEELMKETAPELYVWQKKLEADEKEIAAVVKSFADQEIDKETAKERLLPLLKEEREIHEDPDFQAEQMLAQAYFSSLEYRKKMEAIMRRYMPKPPGSRAPSARGGR